MQDMVGKRFGKLEIVEYEKRKPNALSRCTCKCDCGNRITKKALTFVFLVASPLMIYFVLYAREGIFFLSGNAYEGSILPMQVIMPTLLFR